MKFLDKKFMVLLGIPLAIALVISGAIFQPWKLFIDTEVQESIPYTSESAETTPGSTKTPSPESESESTLPILLAEGQLISHEYETSGVVKILQLSDGTRILRLEDLDTSDGPKVEVWLTDAAVIDGPDGWRVFDDGNYVSLGSLKGNQGNQNYEIPRDLDLSDFSSISLWCVTFSVSFGAAELLPS